MSDKKDDTQYVWVVTERGKDYENFLGLEDEAGERFIPVTAEKDQALILLGRLPNNPEVQRTVEAMHREQIGEAARDDGFALYLVDENGKILERIAGSAAN
ncbi:MAG: hypothetical protein K9K66_13280 [Desulfarculaceae bacterium]|nr:hypothetical protein [Desulfarculaceae bacterium]MCF8073937.1 hypothetical protein [Desulfarculaceae bacterium]MCF8102623.1 hypothetical protein [Desulfarculaceae bacterium]MCF8117608.1 hypothetical protein [Desulfarculaceae bacterium]